ncbi:MAG: rhomboid family intramembrane serine protease [Chloroflexaceae bacterium]|jgi:membrane associated rhomboid family serine protease|nr:rhomboid family intramembrane serine protease [Chloroflexaceae bacterium]
MFPIGDDNPTRRTPVVNHALLVINIVVFLIQIVAGNEFIINWSFIPARFSEFLSGNGDIGAVLTLVSAMFMHAGLAHIFGNMLFLWVFGDNVEDMLGSVPYIIFYLLCGFGATFAQYLTDPVSPIPNLGASGAISGVLAAYMVMFPWARVRLAIWPLVIFIGGIPVPALVLIGLWFVMQLFSGVQDLGRMSQGGTAFWAHVGGFVVGFLLIWLFPKMAKPQQPAYFSQRRY